MVSDVDDTLVGYSELPVVRRVDTVSDVRGNRATRVNLYL